MTPDVARGGTPLAYLFTLEQFGIKLGLANIRTILRALGNPELSFRSVHVAGTNGKGSVTAMVEAALREAGYRSARYTSPHLVDLAERFVIGGRAVDAVPLDRAVDDFRRTVSSLVASHELQGQPTFFEATTAIAFQLFREAGVEVAVCEVGLGGRLDATNVLHPTAAAITTIAFDHQQHLGHTLREIAREKGGIIKPGIPVVIGALPPEARDTIGDIARREGAELVEAWAGTDAWRDDGSRHVRIKTPAEDYGQVAMALEGDHQISNAVVAVRLLELLHRDGIAVPRRAIVRGLETVDWPGRLDRRLLPDGRQALLDAAHNVEGAKALASYLRTAGLAGLPMVFGASSDKDLDDMLAALAPVAGALFLTRASNTRAAEPSDLAVRARSAAPTVPMELRREPLDAMSAAWRRSDRIVVAGSIFLLGDVMRGFGWS